MGSIEIFGSGVGRHVGSVEHVGQDFFGVFQPLGHLCVFVVEGSREGVFTLLALKVDVGHQFLLTREDYLGLVGEVYLDYLVAESEHYGVLRLHPFLDIAIP